MSKTNRYKFKIDNKTLSPLEELNTSNLSPLFYQISLISIARIDDGLKDLSSLIDELKTYLTKYNTDYLEGLFSKTQIATLTSRAIVAQSEGSNNLGKNWKDAEGEVIDLNLTSFRKDNS